MVVPQIPETDKQGLTWPTKYTDSNVGEIDTEPGQRQGINQGLRTG